MAKPLKVWTGSEWVEVAAQLLDDSIYLLTSTASATYLPISASSNFLLIDTASATYLTLDSAANTYLRQDSASAIYLRQDSASATYLEIDGTASYALSASTVNWSGVIGKPVTDPDDLEKLIIAGAI